MPTPSEIRNLRRAVTAAAGDVTRTCSEKQAAELALRNARSATPVVPANVTAAELALSNATTAHDEALEVHEEAQEELTTTTAPQPSFVKKNWIPLSIAVAAVLVLLMMFMFMMSRIASSEARANNIANTTQTEITRLEAAKAKATSEASQAEAAKAKAVAEAAKAEAARQTALAEASQAEAGRLQAERNANALNEAETARQKAAAQKAASLPAKRFDLAAGEIPTKPSMWAIVEGGIVTSNTLANSKQFVPAMGDTIVLTDAVTLIHVEMPLLNKDGSPAMRADGITPVGKVCIFKGIGIDGQRYDFALKGGLRVTFVPQGSNGKVREQELATQLPSGNRPTAVQTPMVPVRRAIAVPPKS